MHCGCSTPAAFCCRFLFRWRARPAAHARLELELPPRPAAVPACVQKRVARRTEKESVIVMRSNRGLGAVHIEQEGRTDQPCPVRAIDHGRKNHAATVPPGRVRRLPATLTWTILKVLKVANRAHAGCELRPLRGEQVECWVSRFFRPRLNSVRLSHSVLRVCGCLEGQGIAKYFFNVMSAVSPSSFDRVMGTRARASGRRAHRKTLEDPVLHFFRRGDLRGEY